MDPKNALRIVAIIEGPKGIPADSRILGFTTIIYDIVKKVVAPAIISCFTLVPSLLSLKNLSITDIYSIYNAFRCAIISKNLIYLFFNKIIL
jgi:hypothetical protein